MHLYFIGMSTLAAFWISTLIFFGSFFDLYLGSFLLETRRAWVHGSFAGCIALDFRMNWMGARLLCLV